MKKSRLLVLLAAMLPFMFASGQDKGKDFSWGVDNVYATRYVAFGSNFSQRQVWQPTVWGKKGNLSGFIMGNKDFERHEFNEVDIGIKYDISLGDKANLTVGAVDFPNKQSEGGNWDGNAGTYFGSLTMNSSMNPSLTVHGFYGDVKGAYASLGISNNYNLNDKVSVSGSTLLEWNNAFREEGQNGLTDFSSSVGLSAKVANNIDISGTWTFTNPLATDIEGGNHFTLNTSYTF